jgi:hypothetical protein
MLLICFATSGMQHILIFGEFFTISNGFLEKPKDTCLWNAQTRVGKTLQILLYLSDLNKKKYQKIQY